MLVTEIAGGTLTRVEPEGTRTTVAECGGGPNGAAIGPDGALYVCNNGGQHFARDGDRLFNVVVNQPDDYVGGSIQRVDINSGEVRTLYTECDGNRLSAPNDLVFDTTGGFWFTDSGKNRARERDWGGVYYAGRTARRYTRRSIHSTPPTASGSRHTATGSMSLTQRRAASGGGEYASRVSSITTAPPDGDAIFSAPGRCTVLRLARGRG